MVTFFNSSSKSNVLAFNSVSKFIRIAFNNKVSCEDINTSKAIKLFDVILKLIKTNDWVFLPEGSNLTTYEILQSPSDKSQQLNSFDLSNLFFEACHLNGITKPAIKIFYYRPFKKLIKDKPILSLFDANYPDDEFIFDQHAVVQVEDYFFDLMISTYYNDENDVFDSSMYGNLLSCISAKEEGEAFNILHQFKNTFDINKTYDGLSLLHRACYLNLTKIAEKLVALGASTTLKTGNRYCQIPLQLLNINNPDEFNSEIFTVLAKGLSNSRINKIKSELLHKLLYNKLAENNFNDFVSIANNPHVNINLKDHYGFTLLHYAASYANIIILNWLLDNHADANLLNNDGCAPLELFFSFETDTFEKLVSMSNPSLLMKLTNSTDESNCQLFWYTDRLITEERLDLLDKLIKVGFDINTKDKQDNGNTLLHKAAQRSKVNVIQFLINNKADLNMTNNEGKLAQISIDQSHDQSEKDELGRQIKKKSEEIIINLGGEILDSLPICELNTPRPIEQIINRALILNAMFQLCMKAPKYIILQWIIDNGLEHDLTPYEGSILHSDDELDVGDYNFIYSSLDSLWALFWATGLTPSLPLDECIGNLAQMSPDLQMNENGDKYIQTMQLLPPISLYEMRDLYYRAHWWVNNQMKSDKQLYIRIISRRRALEWLLDCNSDWDNIDMSC